MATAVAAYEDQWTTKGGSAYSGKTYPGNSATEILTAGIQRLHDNPHAFALSDPEYFQFVMRILHQLNP